MSRGCGVRGGRGGRRLGGAARPAPARCHGTVPGQPHRRAAPARRAAAARHGAVRVHPGRAPGSVLLLVGKRRVAVATPRGARTYPREGVAYGFRVRWGVGPRFVLVLRVAGGRRDTVFTNLSPRGLYVLARRLDPLLREDGRSGARVRTRF